MKAEPKAKIWPLKYSSYPSGLRRFFICTCTCINTILNEDNTMRFTNSYPNLLSSNHKQNASNLNIYKYLQMYNATQKMPFDKNVKWHAGILEYVR